MTNYSHQCCLLVSARLCRPLQASLGRTHHPPKPPPVFSRGFLPARMDKNNNTRPTARQTLPSSSQPAVSTPAATSVTTGWSAWGLFQSLFGGYFQQPTTQPAAVQPRLVPLGLPAQVQSVRYMHSAADQATAAHGAVEESSITAAGMTQESAEAAEAEETAAEEQDGEEEEPDEEALPETTLEYKMPADLFHEARQAAPNTSASFWAYTLYRKVDAEAEGEGENDSKGDGKSDGKGEGEEAKDKRSSKDGERVKVHYCKSKHTTDRVCQQYFLDEPVLGFDLEWMSSAGRLQGARRNVCLVQLASPSRIGLFHLSIFPRGSSSGSGSSSSSSSSSSNDIADLVAPTMKRILEDPAIIKAGVNIKGDCTRLRNHLGIDVRGVFELSHLHKLVKYSRSGETHLVNKRVVALANQVEEHLRLPMFKGDNVRTSDWTKPLRMDQIVYSASDAYAAVQIFSVLEKQRKELDPTPPRPAFAELNVPIKLADGGTVSAATANEEDEEGIEEAGADASEARSLLSPEQLSEAGAQVQYEVDAEQPAEKATWTATPASSKKPAASKMPKDARVAAAEEWTKDYRAGKKAARASPSNLRSYHMWYAHADLDPALIASLLRQPPLQTRTVVGYILEAIRLEALPYDKTRLRTELLDQLPTDVLLRRYRTLAKASGLLGAGGGLAKSSSTSSNTG